MAVLHSLGGNFTAAGSWGTVDATSFLNSTTASTFNTTSYVASSAFTPGAITVDGIGLRFATRAASPSGTFSVELYNSTLGASVAGTEVTINVSDAEAVNSTFDVGGWIFFKFAAPVLLLAATNYQVRIKGSVINQIAVYRDGTAGNWTRLLRTTTTAAPAASDTLIVTGEWTAAATGADITITNDNTATTTFGALELGDRGKFIWGTSASTNYYFKTNSNIFVGAGSTWNMRTVGTPIPSTSTATLEFASTGAGSIGITARNFSTYEICGSSKTIWDYLAADAAVSATALTTATSTGWKSGDEIGIAPTSTTTTQSETRVLNGDASGTTVNITAGLTFAHSGTSLTKAEVINLTRNCRMIGASTSNTFFQRFVNTGSSVRWCEFKFVGSNGDNQHAVSMAGPGTYTIDSCSFHQGNSNEIYVHAVASASFNYTGITITNNVFFGGSVHINIGPNPGVLDIATTVSGSVAMGSTSYSHFFTDSRITTSNIIISGSQALYGFYQQDNTVRSANITNIFVHSSVNGFLLDLVGTYNSTVVDTLKAYLLGGAGIQLNSACDIQFKNIDVRGCLGSGMNITNSELANCVFYNFLANSLSPTTQPAGILSSQKSVVSNVLFNNAIFSGVSANTVDVSVTTASSIATVGGGYELLFNNSTFSAATPVSIQSTASSMSKVGISKWGGTSGSHRTYRPNGLITNDSTIKDTSPFSQRITPSSATKKCLSSIIKVPAKQGQTLTLSVKVRESVVGDGTDYNGNRIRLILMPNGCADSTYQENFTVCATATSASEGAFETLTFTTAVIDEDTVLHFFLDCDGTTGWINWDTIRIR